MIPRVSSFHVLLIRYPISVSLWDKRELLLSHAFVAHEL